MSRRKYRSEGRLERTLGAGIGALPWYMLGRYSLDEGRNCIQRCWRGSSLSYYPCHADLEPLLGAITALGAGDMAKNKIGMDLAAHAMRWG